MNLYIKSKATGTSWTLRGLQYLIFAVWALIDRCWVLGVLLFLYFLASN